MATLLPCASAQHSQHTAMLGSPVSAAGAAAQPIGEVVPIEQHPCTALLGCLHRARARPRLTWTFPAGMDVLRAPSAERPSGRLRGQHPVGACAGARGAAVQPPRGGAVPPARLRGALRGRRAGAVRLLPAQACPPQHQQGACRARCAAVSTGL